MNKKLKNGRVAISHYADSFNSNSLIVVGGIRCETDFLSRSDIFIDSLNEICEILADQREGGAESVLDDLSKESGEQVKLMVSGSVRLAENDPTSYYVHHDNKKAAFVQFRAKEYQKEVRELAYDIAMHVVAFSPSYFSKENVSWDDIDLEISEDILKNKPPEIVEKIKSGKKIKFAKEHVLLDQPFVKDMSKTISQVVEEFNKKHDTDAKLIDYFHIAV